MVVIAGFAVKDIAIEVGKTAAIGAVQSLTVLACKELKKLAERKMKEWVGKDVRFNEGCDDDVKLPVESVTPHSFHHHILYFAPQTYPDDIKGNSKPRGESIIESSVKDKTTVSPSNKVDGKVNEESKGNVKRQKIIKELAVEMMKASPLLKTSILINRMSDLYNLKKDEVRDILAEINEERLHKNDHSDDENDEDDEETDDEETVDEKYKNLERLPVTTMQRLSNSKEKGSRDDMIEQFQIMYPNFETYDSRKETFKKSIFFQEAYVERLSSSGFFNKRDGITQSFCCGLLLRNWNTAEDPWEAHAAFSPSCLFVRQCKGSKFIKQSMIIYGKLSVNHQPQISQKVHDKDESLPENVQNLISFILDCQAEGTEEMFKEDIVEEFQKIRLNKMTKDTLEALGIKWKFEDGENTRFETNTETEKKRMTQTSRTKETVEKGKNMTIKVQRQENIVTLLQEHKHNVEKIMTRLDGKINELERQIKCKRSSEREETSSKKHRKSETVKQENDSKTGTKRKASTDDEESPRERKKKKKKYCQKCGKIRMPMNK